MYIPPVIYTVWQRTQTDCSVACLAMLANVSYEEALLAIGKKSVLTKGVQLAQVVKAGKRLKKTFVLHRHVNLDEDTGILGLKDGEGWDYEHLVLLHNGSIIDAQDKTVWDHETYLAAHKAKVTSLLTLETGPEGE